MTGKPCLITREEETQAKYQSPLSIILWYDQFTS